jgi:hypothetical protein
MNTSDNLLSIIKDALIGKTYAQEPTRTLPEGISAIYYNIDGSERQLYNGTFDISEEGTYVIQAYAVDNAGNTGDIVSQTVTVGPSGECTSDANACRETTMGEYICENDAIICSATTPPEVLDTDSDGVVDCIDNCPTVANPDQANSYNSSPIVTFSKANRADWTQPENQDCITPDVCLTRKNGGGIYNIALEMSVNP